MNIIIKMNNYGLNDDYDYLEIVLDSLDSGQIIDLANKTGESPLDWPIFFIGGREQIVSVAAMKIIAAEIPFSYYVFNTDNNTFLVSYNGGSFNTITITPGNYNPATMIAELQNQLLAITGNTFSISYNSITQKFTFTAPNPFAFQFGGNNDLGNTNPRLWIGFPPGVTSSVGTSLVTPNAIMLSGPNYLFLNSEKFGQTTSLYLPKGAVSLAGGNMGPQMAKIPVTVNSSDTIYYNDPDPLYWFDCEGANFEQVDFYFTMGNNSPLVRFNGLSFSIKIGLLLKKMNNNQEQSGYLGQNRIVKKIRPY